MTTVTFSAEGIGAERLEGGWAIGMFFFLAVVQRLRDSPSARVRILPQRSEIKRKASNCQNHSPSS